MPNGWLRISISRRQAERQFRWRSLEYSGLRALDRSQSGLGISGVQGVFDLFQCVGLLRIQRQRLGGQDMFVSIRIAFKYLREESRRNPLSSNCLMVAVVVLAMRNSSFSRSTRLQNTPHIGLALGQLGGIPFTRTMRTYNFSRQPACSLRTASGSTLFSASSRGQQ